MRLGSDETASSPDDVPDDSSDASSVFKVEHHMAAEASPADLRRREQAATTTHPFPPTSALRNTTCACAGATGYPRKPSPTSAARGCRNMPTCAASAHARRNVPTCAHARPQCALTCPQCASPQCGCLGISRG